MFVNSVNGDCIRAVAYASHIHRLHIDGDCIDPISVMYEFGMFYRADGTAWCTCMNKQYICVYFFSIIICFVHCMYSVFDEYDYYPYFSSGMRWNGFNAGPLGWNVKGPVRVWFFSWTKVASWFRWRFCPVVTGFIELSIFIKDLKSSCLPSFRRGENEAFPLSIAHYEQWLKHARRGRRKTARPFASKWAAIFSHIISLQMSCALRKQPFIIYWVCHRKRKSRQEKGGQKHTAVWLLVFIDLKNIIFWTHLVVQLYVRIDSFSWRQAFIFILFYFPFSNCSESGISNIKK